MGPSILLFFNLGWRLFAHLVGALAAWKRRESLARLYFYAWIVLLIWVPWDALFFHFRIQKDLKFFRSTYTNTLSSAVDTGLLALKVACATCGPVMLYLAFSCHENLRLPAQAGENDIGGLRPK